MFLKSLEINGFKSFADKTKLEFHTGVTGIVGPNGCGKSNVVDAIRWVLGETSAKALRGGEMADVIFNGTDKRKPMGMAEVMLTLGDCEGALGIDFNEVCVGRRVYRDGKSEYLINRKTCRLKDISDLFMDTGIGRSSYSIMEQGKIDMLLSSKPEDRRAVFEEAAGITRFKQQKKEALRKLDYTEANLLRITDVIEEQRRQMGSLQRQAAKARRYQNLLDTVQVLDTHLSHRQYLVLRAEREELANSVKALRKNHEELQQKIERGQTELNEARTAFQKMEEHLASLRQRESEYQNRIGGAKNRIEFNEERSRELRVLIERNESDIESNTEKLSAQERDLANTDENLRSIKEQITRQEQELEQYVSQTREIRKEREAIDRGLRENRNNSGTTRNLIASLTAQLESGQSQLESADRRLEQLAEEVQRVRKELDAKTEEHETLTKDKRKYEDTRTDLEQVLTGLEKHLDTIRRDLSDSRDRAGKLHRQLTEKKTRLETLKQLVASGEGFEKGTREVLKGLDNPGLFKNAVRGVVANFIEVEKEFIPAVEAALGASLQSVLVADSTVAMSMIDSLRKGKRGKASLIPEDFVCYPTDEQLMTLPTGAIGWAMDKVKPEARVQPVIHGLLGNTLIVEDLNRAVDLRKDLPDVNFVTLNGELLTSSGVVTGGTRTGGAAAVLERQAEIRSLEKEVSVLTKDLEKQEKATEDFDHQLKSASTEVEAQRERLQQTRVSVSTIDGQLALVKRESQQFENRLESLRWEEKDLRTRQESGRAKLQGLDEKKREAESTITTLTSACAELESRLENIKEKETESNSLLNELRTSLAVEKRAQQGLEQQRNPMASRLHELREIVARRKQEIQSYLERIDAAEKESDRLRKQILVHGEEVEVLTRERGEAEDARGRHLAVMEQGEAELISVRNSISRLSEQRGNEEVRTTQLELRMENLTGAIQQRYQVDLENFEPDAHRLLAAIEDQQKAQQRSAKRRATMSAGADEPVAEEPTESEQPAAEAEAEEDATDGLELLEENEPDWEFVEGVLGELKRKLDSMGPVNLEAIEEYDELEERFNLMQQQHDDLVNSREELLKVIQKINKTTKTMFAETFEQVRLNFRDMFSELFGKGSQANLVLLDDEDPLESGIEIIAKPPGKKLQSISLLSGGERSMTAVALLFAIYMVKPSPFCVLDELDAPLDDSNIERFCRVLDRFINDSQFIIVTHSKRTMSRADVMYGVSMQEYGVSTTLGMKFSGNEERAAEAGAAVDAEEIEVEEVSEA